MEFIEPISEGATSKVYVIVMKKKDYNLEGYPKEIILKMMEDTDNSYERERRFFEKVGHHDNLVEFIGMYKDSILLEYVPNGNVTSYFIDNLDKCVKLDHKWILQTANALRFIHRHNVSHGDLNTNNMLLDKNLNIKLCDFGKSMKFNEKPIFSTLGYQSPELISAKSKNPELCDVYALGVVIWSLMNRKKPFDPRIDDPIFYNNKIKEGWRLDLDLCFPYMTVVISCWKIEEERSKINIIFEHIAKLHKY